MTKIGYIEGIGIWYRTELNSILIYHKGLDLETEYS